MGRDWLFRDENSVCGLRTAAVLIRDGKILVQREKNGDEYALPGGHVKIGETLEAGLVRELREEIGVSAECARMLWSEECFWKWSGRQAHTVTFYFLVELTEDSCVPKDNVFAEQQDNANVVVGWLPLEELGNVTVYPGFIRAEVYRLDEPIKHFVSRNES